MIMGLKFWKKKDGPAKPKKPAPPKRPSAVKSKVEAANVKKEGVTTSGPNPATLVSAPAQKPAAAPETKADASKEARPAPDAKAVPAPQANAQPKPVEKVKPTQPKTAAKAKAEAPKTPKKKSPGMVAKLFGKAVSAAKDSVKKKVEAKKSLKASSETADKKAETDKTANGGDGKKTAETPRKKTKQPKPKKPFWIRSLVTVLGLLVIVVGAAGALTLRPYAKQPNEVILKETSFNPISRFLPFVQSDAGIGFEGISGQIYKDESVVWYWKGFQKIHALNANTKRIKSIPKVEETRVKVQISGAEREITVIKAERNTGTYIAADEGSYAILDLAFWYRFHHEPGITLVNGQEKKHGGPYELMNRIGFDEDTIRNQIKQDSEICLKKELINFTPAEFSNAIEFRKAIERALYKVNWGWSEESGSEKTGLQASGIDMFFIRVRGCYFEQKQELGIKIKNFKPQIEKLEEQKTLFEEKVTEVEKLRRNGASEANVIILKSSENLSAAKDIGASTIKQEVIQNLLELEQIRIDNEQKILALFDSRNARNYVLYTLRGLPGVIDVVISGENGANSITPDYWMKKIGGQKTEGGN